METTIRLASCLLVQAPRGDLRDDPRPCLTGAAPSHTAAHASGVPVS